MTVSTELHGFDVAQAFADVAADIASDGTVVGARARITVLARDTLGSAGTAIWHLSDIATMKLDSCTDTGFMKLMSDIVGKQPDGPAWQAMHDRETVLADDFATEARWPDYTRRLITESPVRSAVVYPLGLGGVDLGVLAVYSHVSGHFTPARVELGAVFAAHASLALENVSLTDKNRNLEIALQSNRKIGIAMGILMASYRLTEQQSFDLLRATSQTSHRKLSAVAEEVAFTGTIDTLQPTV